MNWIFFGTNRREISELIEKLQQVRLHAKLWVTQTRIRANMEIGMLCCKVDTCKDQAEHINSAQQNQIHSLLQQNQQMHVHLHMLISEKEKYSSKIVKLNEVISSAQEQVQDLSSTMKVVHNFRKQNKMSPRLQVIMLYIWPLSELRISNSPLIKPQKLIVCV